MESIIDGIGRPLWRADLVGGTPNMLMGYPFVINNDMPEYDAVGTTPAILFGNFSKFLVRDVSQVTVTVLRERYAEDNAIAFVAHHRTDAALLNSSAFVGARAGSGSFVNVGIPVE
jgi:HK97 family phage major capsid protein